MITATHDYQPTRVPATLAADRLGTASVLGYVLSGVAPLTVAAGLITVSFAVTGITGIPFTLAIVALFLGLFAVGFLSMARYVANAGAFYSYIARGLGRPWGIGAAVLAFGAYNCLQVALYGIFGATAATMFADRFHTNHSWWLWALLAWAVVAVLGTRDVKWVSTLLGVCIAGETLVILALSVKGLVAPAPQADFAAALSPSGLRLSTFSVAGAVAVLCFVGFEVAPVYREETRRATGSIIAATAIALLSMLVVYGLAAWAMIVHYGQSQVVAVAQQLGPEMLFRLDGDGWLATAGRWLFLSSLFAAMMAFHNAVTRYTYVLGRERVAPALLERVNRGGAPWVASVAQSLIGLAVIVVYAVNGWDPVVRLFFWLGQTGGFLVLGLLALTSIAVVNFFRAGQFPGTGQLAEESPSIWRRLVLPVVAGAGLIWLFAKVWANYSLLLGESTPSLASRLLPAGGVVLLLVGLARAGWLYAFHRDIYQQVGQHEVATVAGSQP
jgi:amino acid transporter